MLHDELSRRIGRNAGLLLGGNSIAGLIALAAVAVAARGLGVEAFGILMVVHAYAMLVGGLSRFNVYQALVRYGAACLLDERRRDLQGLLIFGLLVELAGIAAGALMGVLAMGWVGPMLGISQTWQTTALWYCLVVITANTATPIGILRLLDRFDLVAWTRPVTPTLRLVGCLLAWFAGAGFATFAAIWAVAGVAEALLLWGYAGLVLRRDGWLSGFAWRIRGLVRPHPGLWRMVIWTNLQGSLGLVSGRLATVAVGMLLGPAAGGLYLVAYQAASVIERPLQLVKRALDPEFARLAAAGDGATLTTLYRRMLLLTALIAGPLLLLLALAGDRLLALLVGAEFAAAHGVLVLLAIKTTALVLAMPASSLLVMLDDAGRLFALQLVGRSLFLAGLVLLVPGFGLMGAGTAAVVAAALELVLARCAVQARFRRLPKAGTPTPGTPAMAP